MIRVPALTLWTESFCVRDNKGLFLIQDWGFSFLQGLHCGLASGIPAPGQEQILGSTKALGVQAGGGS